MWCIIIPMGRTNIDIDDRLVHAVMDRYHLSTKRDAVDFALRMAAGQPMSRSEVLSSFGSRPEFATPTDELSAVEPRT